MRATVLDWKRIIDEVGIVVPWGWGSVYNNAAELRNVELLMMDAYINFDMYDSLLSKIADAQSYFNMLLARSGIECIGIQGNIANGAMVSCDFFREFIQPYEQRVIKAIKSEGTYVLYHNCGNAKALYKNYIDMGITVWETVAPPPQGDNCLADAKACVGEHICIMGNIDQVDFLKNASTDEVSKKTEEIVSVGRPGGKYVFAASDYIERNTPIENIKAMIQTAKSAGKYRAESNYCLVASFRVSADLQPFDLQYFLAFVSWFSSE